MVRYLSVALVVTLSACGGDDDEDVAEMWDGTWPGAYALEWSCQSGCEFNECEAGVPDPPCQPALTTFANLSVGASAILSGERPSFTLEAHDEGDCLRFGGEFAWPVERPEGAFIEVCADGDTIAPATVTIGESVWSLQLTP